MALGSIIAQVLLTILVGLWVGVKFQDNAIVRFFARNDWFLGSFLVLLGYLNYNQNYLFLADYLKNVNLVLIAIGFVLILFSIIDLSKNK